MTRERGGAALEYILVTTFAAVVGIAALGFIGKVVRAQLANLANRLGMEEPPDSFDPFGDGGGGSFARLLLLAMLWVAALELRAQAHGLVRELATFAGLRRSLLVAPAPALAGHCAKPALAPCRREVRWWQRGAWRDVCTADGSPPGGAELAVRRRYELTLACDLAAGAGRWPLPTLRTIVLR